MNFLEQLKSATCCLNICYKVLSHLSLVEGIRTLFSYFPIGFCKLCKSNGFIFFQDITIIPTEHFTEREENITCKC